MHRVRGEVAHMVDTRTSIPPDDPALRQPEGLTEEVWKEFMDCENVSPMLFSLTSILAGMGWRRVHSLVYYTEK